MRTRMFAGAMAALALEGAAASAALADPRDQAWVRQTVLAVPTNADLREFGAIAPLFAEQTTIDYTSLWGGTAETMTPEALVTAWRCVLPGFDATWHEIGEIEVQITGDRARASASVDARHWLGNGFWRIMGRYDFRLSRQDGRWRITRMTLTVTGEEGDRSLVGAARQAAASDSCEGQGCQAPRADSRQESPTEPLFRNGRSPLQTDLDRLTSASTGARSIGEASPATRCCI